MCTCSRAHQVTKHLFSHRIGLHPVPGTFHTQTFSLRRMMVHDRRLEPRVGERVPYVIVYGSPGVPLIQLVRRPLELLQDPALRLNSTYYITKQILPPVARIFSLIGVDVFGWYHTLPRVRRGCRVYVGGVRECVLFCVRLHVPHAVNPV